MMINVKLLLFFVFISSISFAQGKDTLSTDSGLKYLILHKSNGNKSISGMEMEVHYNGSFVDGKKFDSSYDRNEPITFVLGAQQMIPGFDEGVSLMSVGDKYKFIIPYQLAYGEEGRGPIPPKATLIFDVELLSMSAAKAPIADTLYSIFKSSGIEEGLKLYSQLKSDTSINYDFREPQLNTLGYRLLQINKIPEAIKVFELNVESFPESGNVYDSLAEGYMMNTEIDKAIEFYKKSLALNPENSNAVKMIELLELEKGKIKEK